MKSVQNNKRTDKEFLLFCVGQVESAQFQRHDNLYCKYSFTLGSSWTIAKVARGASVASTASIVPILAFLWEFRAWTWQFHKCPVNPMATTPP